MKNTELKKPARKTGQENRTGMPDVKHRSINPDRHVETREPGSAKTGQKIENTAKWLSNTIRTTVPTCCRRNA